MSSPGSPTLDIDVRPRRAESCVAGASILLTAIAPWLLPATGAVTPAALVMTGAASLAGAVLTWVGFRAAGWLGGSRRVVRVSWQADGQWKLTDGREKARGMGLENELSAELRPDTRVGTGWVWLRWNAEGVRSMLLIQGDVSNAELRRLCLRLRLERPKPLPAAL
jgi:hypothetical protein